MDLRFILGAVGLASLALIIVNKERSFLYIVGLVASCLAAFGIAFSFSQPLLLILLILPVSVYVAWLARDELKVGRRWFFALIVLSRSATLFFLYYGFASQAYASGFVGLGTLVGIVLSYCPSWIRTKGTWESNV